jgi:predicted transcriptional regulator
MDHIFKALANPTRQKLLDALRPKDGQTRTDLKSSLDMTRFGVMTHLKLLKDANLFVTQKIRAFQILLPKRSPLQEVMERWVAPFLQPQAKALSQSPK